MRWYFNGRKLKQVDTGLTCVGPGRPLLENRIRARVQALPNVVIRERTDILGVVASADRRRVTGARVQSQLPGAPEETLEADLVVDATGRGSRTARWLEELGYPTVTEDRVKMGLTYTSADFDIDEADDLLGDDIASIPVATPEIPRGAIYARIGGGHSVSLTGLLGQKPPTDRAGFLAYARSLPAPEVYEAIRKAEFVADPITFSFPASVRRRYDKLGGFPDGFLVMGDAACIFNPVYAQGMTVAAMEAMILREHVTRGLPVQPRKFLRDISRATNAPWEISAGGDLSFPQVEGKRGMKVRMGNLYIPRLQAAAEFDGVLSAAFIRSASLVAPPTALLKPGMIVRTLRGKKSPPVPDPVYAAVPAAPASAAANGESAAVAERLGG